MTTMRSDDEIKRVVSFVPPGNEWRTAGQVVPDCEYSIVGMTVIQQRASSELVGLTRDPKVAAQIVHDHTLALLVPELVEALRKALTCASLNSDVRQLVLTALTNAAEQGGRG